MGNLKDRMFQRMKELGIQSQYELAKRANIEYKVLNHWFTGHVSIPEEENLLKVAKVLEVSPAWLRYGDKEYAPSINDDVVRIAEKLEEYGKEHPENIKKLEQIIDVCIGSGVDFRQDTAIPEKLQKKKGKGILQRTA